MSASLLTTKWQYGGMTWGHGLTRSVEGWFKLASDNKISPPKFDMVFSREKDGRKYFYFCELSQVIDFTKYVAPVPA